MSAKAIAVNPKDPKNFIEIELPTPEVGAFDLLVEVKAVSVNPVDTKVHAGIQKNGTEQPRVLGWDASGVVLKVGANVTSFKVGDEVWYAGDVTRSGSNATQQLVDARIAAIKPSTQNWAQSAALPLTAITAWEGLFEHLKIQNGQDKGLGKTLLIIGGAGGVGSLAISLAKLRSNVKVIATASSPASVAWCLERGADLTVDYRDLKTQLANEGISHVDYIFCLNDTDGHWAAIGELIAPLGQICTIVENEKPLDQSKLKQKSVALHWEFMFTRSMFKTSDMAEQGEILKQVANLLDEGKLKSTLKETLHGLSVETLQAAHEKVKSGRMQGKLVIEY